MIAYFNGDKYDGQMREDTRDGVGMCNYQDGSRCVILM